jgi:Leu/Phe-tRNA-protein transferase
MKGYKLSVWITENSKEVLWYTHYFQTGSMHMAMAWAADHMVGRISTLPMTRTEVKAC